MSINKYPFQSNRTMPRYKAWLVVSKHDNVHKISQGNHVIRSEPCWLIETWGGTRSYWDQTSPAARLMWLKQLVAQDTECWRFSPPLRYNYWCRACTDICRCSWSMSGLIIDHSCISSHMKLRVKSVSSCAARTVAETIFVRLYFECISMSSHCENIKPTVITHTQT